MIITIINCVLLGNQKKEKNIFLGKKNELQKNTLKYTDSSMFDLFI